MSHTLEELVDACVSRLEAQGVTIRRDDNTLRLRDLEAKLPKRLPQSFDPEIAIRLKDARSLFGLNYFL
jgi:hypothetical protein